MLCWSGPEHNPWFSMTRQVAIERLGPIDPPAPDAPGPMAFKDIERVTDLLGAAGYENVEGEESDIRLVYPGDAAALAGLASELGGVGAVVRERGASEADLSAIRNELEGRLDDWAQSDGVHVPARLNIFRARRPAA